MTSQRTFVTWLASAVLGAVTLVGVGSGFASTNVISSASAVSSNVGLGSAGSLQNQVPCPPAAVSL